MVKIRLKRVGKKKQPAYRVVVADSRSPRDGRIIEAIGHYQPRLEPSEITIDNPRAVHWLQKGAQPSDQVRKLLQISGAWSEFTGEAPPQPVATPEERKRKATPAASVKTEPEPEAADTVETATPEPTPEAVDQSGAAPEAETDADAEAVPEAQVAETEETPEQEAAPEEEAPEEEQS